MDVFARVCEALRENDFNRLRRCAARVDPGRPFSTWLVAVVHNLTIDWFATGTAALGSRPARPPFLRSSSASSNTCSSTGARTSKRTS